MNQLNDLIDSIKILKQTDINEYNQDCFIGIIADEGVGKTLLATRISTEIDKKYTEKNAFYKRKPLLLGLKELLETKEKGRIIHIDEPKIFLTNTVSREGSGNQAILTGIRKLGTIFIYCASKLNLIKDKTIIFERTKLLIKLEKIDDDIRIARVYVGQDEQGKLKNIYYDQTKKKWIFPKPDKEYAFTLHELITDEVKTIYNKIDPEKDEYLKNIINKEIELEEKKEKEITQISRGIKISKVFKLLQITASGSEKTKILKNSKINYETYGEKQIRYCNYENLQKLTKYLEEINKIKGYQTEKILKLYKNEQK